jgi:hypothetical protein
VHQPVAGLGQQRLNLTGYGPCAHSYLVPIRGNRTRRIEGIGGNSQQKHKVQDTIKSGEGGAASGHALTLDSRVGIDGSARQTARHKGHGAVRGRRAAGNGCKKTCMNSTLKASNSMHWKVLAFREQ